MPSRSHGRCKVCRAITHINSRFGLCATHMRQRNQRIEAERKEAKARKARRLAATIVLEEGPDMTEQAATPDKRGRRPVIKLTDDQRIEILDAYTKTDETVNSIVDRFGIHPTYIFNVLDRVGVSWRRKDAITYEQWQAQQAKPVEKTVPPEVEHALENMLKLPPTPEPVAPTPTIERRVSTLPAVPTTVYVAEVSGLIEVSAGSMIEAIEILLHDYADLRVKSIREA